MPRSPEEQHALGLVKLEEAKLKIDAWDDICFYTAPGMNLADVGYKSVEDAVTKIRKYHMSKLDKLWAALQEFSKSQRSRGERLSGLEDYE